MSELLDVLWAHVSVDFAEMSDKASLFLITDNYSKFPVMKTVMVGLFSEFGIPKKVRSDRRSKEFKSFANDLGFKQRKITST